MSKYKIHRMSKYEFNTVGDLVGHKAAQSALVRRLGRPLREGTKIVTKGGNWVFQEPKGTSGTD
jgi:hypothetical protein